MFYYAIVPGATMNTSGSANTEVDELFIKPGTRNVNMSGLYVQGRATGAVSITGLNFRVKKFTTTATALNTGTSLTPTTRDQGSPAAKCTSAWNNAGAFTPGSGGPSLLLSIGCGQGSAGGWMAPNPDGAMTLEGSANMSLDVFSVTGGTTIAHELSVEVFE